MGEADAAVSSKSGQGKREIWIKHYSSSHRILLVGEGDFSFSACLGKAFGSAKNMIATSYDNLEAERMRVLMGGLGRKVKEAIWEALMRLDGRTNVNLDGRLRQGHESGMEASAGKYKRLDGRLRCFSSVTEIQEMKKMSKCQRKSSFVRILCSTWYQSSRLLTLHSQCLLHHRRLIPQIASPASDTVSIPPQLKFFMANVKTMVTVQLNTDNQLIWKSQLLKFFAANNYEWYITGTSAKPPKQILATDGSVRLNSLFTTWMLIDQHLASAIYSNVSASLLLYILNLDSSHQIWTTLELCLKSTHRSRLLQLKNELHQLQLGDKTMFQYLTDIKAKVDTIAAEGSSIDTEDIILYTLNGLQATYQSFKVLIHNQLQPIYLDDFYALLCSEELHISSNNSREHSVTPITDSNYALTATRGTARGRASYYRGRQSSRRGDGCGGRSTTRRYGSARGGRITRPLINCQIYGKPGHSAINCWYRHDSSYNSTPQAYVATYTTQNADWFIDSGATEHLTTNQAQLQNIQPYNGSSLVQVENGQQLPIAHTGQGLLPTPSRKLQLPKILHVPNLSHNLLYIHKLTNDNSCFVLLDANDFSIKDSRTNKLLLHRPNHHGLYPIKLSTTPSSIRSTIALLTTSSSSNIWHQRLGHPSTSTFRLLSTALSTSISIASSHCNTCAKAKCTRLSFSVSTTISKQCLEFIQSDTLFKNHLMNNLQPHSVLSQSHLIPQNPHVLYQFLNPNILWLLEHRASKARQILDLHSVVIPANPTDFTQASQHLVWRQAMSAEFEALQKQGMCVLVPSTAYMNIMGCKRLFKTKFHANGSVARYKACLIAQGFKQEDGLDYHETFSRVVKFPTIRILLTIIFPHHVCLLKKAIYGLKQVPRQLVSTYSSYLLQYGFRTSSTDPSRLLFHQNSIQLYVLVYVDDILVTDNSTKEINRLLTALHSTFSMRNLGTLNTFLGIQATYTPHGTLTLGLPILSSSLCLTGFADSDWATNHEDIAQSQGCPTLLFEDSVVDHLVAPYALTLIGKFMLRRLNLDVIRKFFVNLKLSGCFHTDQATASVSHLSIARVLVEMDVSKKHQTEIWIGCEVKDANPSSSLPSLQLLRGITVPLKRSLLSTGHLKPVKSLTCTRLSSLANPPIYSSQSAFGLETGHECRIEALQKQGMCVLVPSTAYMNIMGCKRLFKTKFHANGSVARYKACLIAQVSNKKMDSIIMKPSVEL
ncbi:hypothetical protein KFK09_006907 [Dendrobium nobile]|uniref:Uncharacterized protein n=1 Tax=Dendrobium nobile TaxID=94219 RepID=A0A8T3BSW0_DENNO|nr:hypothetical protein KFK09_006907 [Dendrobium nobile]